MSSRTKWIAGLSGVVVALVIAAGGIHAYAHRLRTKIDATSDPGRWPGERARLTKLAVDFPPGFGVARVVIDPGHGAPNNRGNSSSYCVDEQDVMMELAEALRDRLEATGHVEVQVSREPGVPLEYAKRVDEAAAWGAQAFVSLHSDVRGKVERWMPAPGRVCALALDAPGFSVLYSDEGDVALVALRHGFARAMATRMAEVGFPAYGGGSYTGLYDADDTVSGVFVDRHAPDRRIYVLRRTTMPAIIVETHNALDPREASRWTRRETLDAFAGAVAAALADVLGQTKHPG